MSTLELYQGDSSDVVSVSVTNAGVVVTDLANYAGTFAIVKTLGDDALLSKAMTAVSSKFQAVLTPAESAALTPGSYIGIAEITNDVLGYNVETRFDVLIKQQGYSA